MSERCPVPAAAIQVLIPAVAPLHLLFASSDKMTLDVVPLSLGMEALATEEGHVLLPSRKVGSRPLTSTWGATRFFSSG